MLTIFQDFNYHAYIYETDTHSFRTATSGGVPFGSGLNTLSNFDWTGFTRVTWDTCSNASGSDCLTPKGFTYMRMLLSSSTADGTTAQYMDVYNLHTDAGTEADDIAARNSNLAQVSAHVKTWSEGVPVLVFGDTNSRYTRLPDDIEIFGRENGLLDAWVQVVHGGSAPTVESLCANPSLASSCETVDKVFYRGSPLGDLTATQFRYDSTSFLQADGNILSDHNPVRVNFTLGPGSTIRMSPLFGGPHGDPYSDVNSVAAAFQSSSRPKVTRIVLRGGSRLDSIGAELSNGLALTHGGTGGSEAALDLAAGENWTGASLCQGQKDGQTRIFYAKVATSAGRSVSAGASTSDCATFSAPSGWQIAGFIGRDGDEIDQLSFLFARR
jgi:hypothetical protein